MDKKRIFTNLISLVVAVILISTAFYFGLQAKNQNSPILDGEVAGALEKYPPELVPSPLPTGPVDIPIDSRPFLGQADAPILVVEFLDYQCPYCKEFAENIVANLKEEYIDSGQVRFVTKDFPLTGHETAWPASLAANCVHKIAGAEIFFKYHDLLFDQQAEWIDQEEPKDLFVSFGQQVGLDKETFERCYDNQEPQEDIQQDIQDGQAVGVNGTPVFFVNGKVFVGVPPTFEDMREIIESAL